MYAGTDVLLGTEENTKQDQDVTGRRFTLKIKKIPSVLCKKLTVI